MLGESLPAAVLEADTRAPGGAFGSKSWRWMGVTEVGGGGNACATDTPPWAGESADEAFVRSIGARTGLLAALLFPPRYG